MSRRIYMMMVVLMAVCQRGHAQYDVSFSHYFDMEPSFNPAAIGKEAKLNVAAAYAIDLAGFEHNPQTAYAGADLPFYFLNANHGAGVQFMNDKIGLFTHQRIAGQYAFKQRLFGGQLSVGLQAGLLTESFDGSKLDLDVAEDPAFVKSETTGNALDLAAGLYYAHKRWYIGASVQHVNAPLVELGETNELQIDRTYYLTGGYNIKLRNPFLSIPASALARYDGTSFRADITGRLVYTHEERMLYGGLSYSPTNSVTVMIGGSFHGINLGYSYEVYTSAINPGNGSHELIVTYQTDINLQKKGRNKHKSVRFL